MLDWEAMLLLLLFLWFHRFKIIGTLGMVGCWYHQINGETRHPDRPIGWSQQRLILVHVASGIGAVWSLSWWARGNQTPIISTTPHPQSRLEFQFRNPNHKRKEEGKKRDCIKSFSLSHNDRFPFLFPSHVLWAPAPLTEPSSFPILQFFLQILSFPSISILAICGSRA